jgi:hypothetical protein
VVASADDKSPLAKDLRLVVGQTFSNQSVFPYIGQLDELAIYNRALIESEIQKHYESVQRIAKIETTFSFHPRFRKLDLHPI